MNVIRSDEGRSVQVLGDQVRNGLGVTLDGDGDGAPGGNYVLSLHRLFGDGNGDRRVDVADLGLFAGTYLKQQGEAGYLAYFDFNHDTRVDVADLGQFAARYQTMLP